jgi:hypothetical protein
VGLFVQKNHVGQGGQCVLLTGEMMRIRETIHEYGEDIIYAKLDGLAKGLLWLYAFHFEWADRIPARLTEREICALSGMSQSTYYKKRVYLESLGWIKVEHMGFNKPCSVYPLVGSDDSDYETRSWANWHPFKHPYLGLIRSEQIKMAAEGVDVPFSEVYQLFEDDDELYESFVNSPLSEGDSEEEKRFKNFVQNVREFEQNQGLNLEKEINDLAS